MKDLLGLLSADLAFLPRKINTYDIRAVFEVYNLADQVEFTYKPQFGSRKYSPEFAAWIKDNVMRDRFFLKTARTAWRRRKKEGR